MTANSIEQIQQQLKDHEAAGAELRKQLAAVQANLRNEALAEVEAIMARHNLTPADLMARVKSPGKKTAATSGTAKYRDPKTGKTWTGHGMRPNWLKAYIAAGQADIDFLVSPAQAT